MHCIMFLTGAGDFLLSCHVGLLSCLGELFSVMLLLFFSTSLQVLGQCDATEDLSSTETWNHSFKRFSRMKVQFNLLNQQV